jgi:hypothetical protein
MPGSLRCNRFSTRIFSYAFAVTSAINAVFSIASACLGGMTHRLVGSSRRIFSHVELRICHICRHQPVVPSTGSSDFLRHLKPNRWASTRALFKRPLLPPAPEAWSPLPCPCLHRQEARQPFDTFMSCVPPFRFRVLETGTIDMHRRLK